MNRIEIKYRRKLAVPFFIGISIFTVVVACLAFFLGESQSINHRIYSIGGILLIAWLLYPSLKKLIKDEALIVWTDQAIVLQNRRRPVTITRNEIEHMEVILESDSGHFLNIKTSEKTHKVGLNWLDKTPDEVREIIKSFMR